MTEHDDEKRRRGGGRTRTRYAKKRHALQQAAEAATDDEVARQERKVAALLSEVKAAQLLLELMHTAQKERHAATSSPTLLPPTNDVRRKKPKPKPKSSFIKREYIESEEEEEEEEETKADLASPEVLITPSPAQAHTNSPTLPPLANDSDESASGNNHSDSYLYRYVNTASAEFKANARITSRSDLDTLDGCNAWKKKKRHRTRYPLGLSRLPTTVSGEPMGNTKQTPEPKPLLCPFGIPMGEEALDWADTWGTDDGDLLQAAGEGHRQGSAAESGGEECVPEKPLGPRLSEPAPPLIIALLGHVAHGKSSVVKMLTHKTTMAFREERIANATIKLGYADACIYRSLHMLRGQRRFFMTGGSEPVTDPIHPETGEPCEFVRKVSFIDCPGHDKYVTTVLAGASTVDAGIMVVSSNENFPQRQTLEHFNILKERKIRSENLIVVHNKIDITGTQSLHHLQSIRKLVGHEASVIPCCAVRGTNREALIASIFNLPPPVRNRSLDVAPVFRVIRSFDINKKTKEGDKTEKSGGVIGGCVLEGVVYRGDEITLLPGLVRKKPANSDGAKEEEYYEPVTVTIVKLTSEGKDISRADPGALVGMETNLPPHLAKADRLVGQMSGSPGDNVELFSNTITLQSMTRNRDGDGRKMKKLKEGDNVWVMAGARRVAGCALEVDKNTARLSIEGRICCTPFERVTLLRIDSSGVCKILAWGTMRTSIEEKPAPAQPLITLAPEHQFRHGQPSRVRASRKPAPVASKRQARAKTMTPGELSTDEDLSVFYSNLKVSSQPDLNNTDKTAPPSRRAARKAKGIAASSSTMTEFSAPKPPPRKIAKQLLSDSEDEILRLKKPKKKRRLAQNRDSASESGEDCEGESDAVYAGLLYQGLDGMKVPETKAFKIPAPRVARVSRHCCAVSNYPNILKALKREAEHVRAFISTELSALASIDPNGVLMLNRVVKPSSLEVVFRKYAFTYITCRMCHGSTTIDRLDKGLFELRCASCNATRAVSSQQTSLYTAVKPGERKTLRKNSREKETTRDKDSKDREIPKDVKEGK